MFKTIAAVLFLLGVTSAFVRVIRIDDETDKMVRWVNQLLTEKGYGMIDFPALPGEEVQVGPGVHIGLNTLERRGHATFAVFHNGSAYLDYPLSLKLSTLAFANLTWDRVEMAGLFRARTADLRVSYWVHNKTSCSVQLDRFALTKLDNATLYSSEPTYDGRDVSELFRGYILPINQFMDSQRDPLEKAIEKATCSPDSDDAGKSLASPPGIFSFLRMK